MKSELRTGVLVKILNNKKQHYGIFIELSNENIILDIRGSIIRNVIPHSEKFEYLCATYFTVEKFKTILDVETAFKNGLFKEIFSPIDVSP